MRYIILLLLLSSMASAATLRGTIYNSDLSTPTDVLLEINTSPQQRLLVQDGNYEFEIPPGFYLLTATTKDAQVAESIVVAQNGTFAYDLFLFADFTEDTSLYDDITQDFEEAPNLPQEKPSIWPLMMLIFFILLALALPLLWLRRKFVQAGEHLMQSEEEMILDILQRNGGKITQKELRSHISQSEAKISLMVAALEAEGKIKKIKKGRGNILVLCQ